MCNPIGYKATTKHKLGMIYWTIANIHPMYRTNLQLINLAGIVKSEDIKRYGMNYILTPIVQSLRNLIIGIEDENGEVIRGNLYVVSADNLRQKEVSGFKKVLQLLILV